MKKRAQKQKLKIDFWFLVFTIPLFVSGYCLHLSSHHPLVWSLDYQVWTILHFFFSIPVYYLLFMHIVGHLNWFLRLSRDHLRNNYFVWLTSILFTLTALTGIVTLFFPGPSSDVGIVHFLIGIPTSLISLDHVFHFRRFIQLPRKPLKNRIKQ